MTEKAEGTPLEQVTSAILPSGTERVSPEIPELQGEIVEVQQTTRATVDPQTTPESLNQERTEVVELTTQAEYQPRLKVTVVAPVPRPSTTFEQDSYGCPPPPLYGEISVQRSSICIGTDDSGSYRDSAPTVSRPGTRISIILLESIRTQTEDSLESVPQERDSDEFTAVDRYPTSKLGQPLPEGIDGDKSTKISDAAPLTVERGQRDLRWLKWAAECQSPRLQAYVASVTKDKSQREEFFRIDSELQVPPKVSESWHVPVRMGNRVFHLLCDTGSAATIISPRVYKRLPLSVKTPLVKSGVRLRSASKDGLSVSGLCCLEMELGNEKLPCRVIVADVDYDGILGSNFLEHYKCVIDIASGRLQLPHGALYMAKGSKPSVCRVTTSSDVEVPAHTQLVLSCHVKSHHKMTSPVSVVECTRSTVSRFGILIGRCLVSTRPQVPVLFLNSGPMPVSIPAGSSIALLKPISYLDDLRIEEIFEDGVGVYKPTPVETAAQSHPLKNISPSAPNGADGSDIRTNRPVSNTRLDSTLTSGGLSECGGRNLFPVHSSLNSMVSDVDSSVSGNASSWLENESGPPSVANDKLSANRVESWNYAPRADSPPPSVWDTVEFQLVSHADAVVEPDETRHPELVHDSLGEPRIGVKLAAGTEHLYIPPSHSPIVTPQWKPVTLVSATRYLSSDTDDYTTEEKSSDFLSSEESSGSVDSDTLSSESETEQNYQEARLATIEKWCRAAEKPVFVPDHLRGLIARDLPKEDQYELAKTLYEYEDIFVGPDGVLGRTDIIKHDIDTTSSRPIKHAPRRMSPHQQEIISQEVDKMLKSGVITESDSPWASPVVLVRKKDGSVRFCIDYRKLNNVTLKDAYPLPNIEDAVNTLCGAKYFCTLDLASGYWQVELTEDAKRKSAFVTREGLFEFNVMPFGLSNAPATFERLMELVLRGMTWRQCVVYIDDVIVFGTSFDETHGRLTRVFDRLRQAHLKLKAKKCFLFKDSTLYLGYMVSSRGIEPDPAKIEAIRTWNPPCNLKGLRAFLGMCSYHRKFIPNFAHIAEPLILMTRKRKNPVFVWGEDQQSAFEHLRNSLMTEPVLSHPTKDGKFVLDTDASNHAIGGALYQIQDGEERVISYASKTLTDSQRNYCTTKRELLAVVRMIKYFRHYLWGAPFTIRTDHASLAWLLRFKDADGMLARWLAELALFQFTIMYRSGDKHLNADGLSRRRCKGCPRPDCPDKLSPTTESLVSSSED